MKILDENLLQRFKERISEKTGLRIRSQDDDNLCKVIHARTKFHKLSTPEAYYQFLNNDTDQSRHEQQELIGLLTVGESYFFRDKGQFELLKNVILPELIACRKSERILRIWSAGCSTGEEPYSFAILVDELFPQLQDWDILILGTDINKEALERARRGVYTKWSFRMVDPLIRERYFVKRNDEWEIDEKIKRMVEFHYGNLLGNSFPVQTSQIHNMDIILCRNVFIYLNDKAISGVIKKFTATLNEGGYLITGHGELYAQNLRQLRTILFQESAVYKKISESELRIEKLTPIHHRLKEFQKVPLHPLFSKGDLMNFPASPKNLKQISQSRVPADKKEGFTHPNLQPEIEKCFLNGDYITVIEKAKSIIKDNSIYPCINKATYVRMAP